MSRKTLMIAIGYLLLIITATDLGPVTAQTTDAPEPGNQHCDDCKPMDNAHLDTLIRRIDENAERAGGTWRLTVAEQAILIITDERANRMRILAQVAQAKTLSQEDLIRLMQANFDTSLDARYCVAQGVLWSAFIHPLGTLNERDFLSGLGQVVNLVSTYGTSYSSGALIFGGGNSGELQRRELIEQLIERGLSI